MTSITDDNSGVTTLAYEEGGNLASVTDPEGNTTQWVYDDQDRLIQETGPLGESKYYVYDTVGELVRYVAADGEVRQYDYDSEHRVVTETWYADTTDADAEENALNTIHYAYDAAGRIVSESDDDSSNAYAYDEQGRLATVTEECTLGPPVVLTYTYEGESTRPSTLAISIDGTADFLNTYEYNTQGNLIQIIQTGQSGGNAVAEKEIDLTYEDGQVESITRYLDGQLVVVADYDYDSSGRLVGLVYHQGETILASYTWTYSGDASSVLSNPQSLIPNPWLPNGGLPIIASVGANKGMLPVYDTADIATALWVGNSWGNANLLTSCTSSDGTVTYTYDPTGQLIGASYTGGQSDEAYAYDANGNRETANGSSYVTGADNRLISDGTYTYSYDAEGNRIAKFIDANADGVLDAGDTTITVYGWDVRNRLTSVTTYATFGADPTQVVEYRYDPENRLVGETVSVPGQAEHQTYFVYDGKQIALQFDKDGSGAVTGADLSHRYLSAVDQVFADEQVANPQAGGNVVWPLADNLGTVRDLAVSQNGITSVANHRVFDSYGNLVSQTNAAVDYVFGFTGFLADKATGLDMSQSRPYDPRTGRWTQEDRIGFAGRDTNLSRYVGNSPTNFTDPTGMAIVGPPIRDVPPPSWWPSWLYWPWSRENQIAMMDPSNFICPIGMVKAPLAKAGASRLARLAATIERHHLLPEQFVKQFERVGLKIKDYMIPLNAGAHRLSDYGGVHCGKFEESWNGMWKAFFDKYPNATKEQILEQLAKMREIFGI